MAAVSDRDGDQATCTEPAGAPPRAPWVSVFLVLGEGEAVGHARHVVGDRARPPSSVKRAHAVGSRQARAERTEQAAEHARPLGLAQHLGMMVRFRYRKSLSLMRAFSRP
jgi:hypothetical protein